MTSAAGGSQAGEFKKDLIFLREDLVAIECQVLLISQPIVFES